MTGRIKVYKADRQFGFIKRDDTGKDVFFHRDYLMDMEVFRVGDRVRFDLKNHTKGPAAVNVELIR